MYYQNTGDFAKADQEERNTTAHSFLYTMTDKIRLLFSFAEIYFKKKIENRHV